MIRYVEKSVKEHLKTSLALNRIEKWGKGKDGNREVSIIEAP